jgi:hypothetical protein
METKYASLKFKAKVKPVEKLNEEFTLCKCYVQGVGKNRNYSYMSKENIIKNSPTLHYAPVVGHLIQKEDGSLYMGGHDWTIDENCNFKSICVPYGVVTMDEFEFEEVDEYGEKVEYMTANIVLWTGRYPELMEAIYSEDIFFNQSMEIAVEQYRPYEEDSNYMELLDWTYSALCMLGKADDKDSPEHTEPCFIESKIIPHNFSKAEFAEVMTEMKQGLAFYFEKKGAEETVEEVKEVVMEETQDDDESVTEEVVEEVVEEVTAEEEVVVEEEEIVVEEETSEEVAIEPEVEEEVENVELNALQSEFDTYKASHTYSNDEYEELKAAYNELKEFKDNYDAAELKSQKDAIFARGEYSVLAENEEFKKLIADAEQFSVAEVESKAKAIFADHVIQTGTFSVNDKKSKKDEFVAFNFNKKESKKGPYGNLFNKD